jgi:hypothetical protein
LIPCDSIIESHNNIKNYLINIGFNVFVINGNEKLLFNENNNILTSINDITKPDELSINIGEIYEKYNLKNKKIAITGNLCITPNLNI